MSTIRRPRTKRHKPNAEINVVPYIDVMMVLLVIFMVTAPMLTQGVNVDLPQAKSDPCLLYTSPSPRDATLSRMPSSA